MPRSVADCAAQADPERNPHFRRGRDWPPEQLPRRRSAPSPPARPDFAQLTRDLVTQRRRTMP
jgi:hypothetical protein